jgi:hypothetical protein
VPDLIVCSCADEIARHRLEQDAVTGAHPARNRDYDLYLSLKRQWEPVAGPALSVDTGAPYQDCLAQCLAYIRSQDRESPAG